MDRIDPEVIRRLLNQAKSGPGNSARVTKETTDLEGKLLYKEQDETTIDEETMQPEIRIRKVTPFKCGCDLPIDERMLMSDQVKICTICKRLTCSRCWANTDQHEYLKAEVRGQTICKPCYNTHAEKLFIKCDSCGQTLRDYYDMKVCAGWHDSPHMVCPSCGIPGETGQLVCRECYPKYLALMEELRV